MAQNIDLSNLEEILDNTSPEDLQELRDYLMGDSTNSYHCDKPTTGPLDIESLRQYMEEAAKNEEDWPELVPHVAKSKSSTNNLADQDITPQPESAFDSTIQEALDACDPEDFAELAAILGTPGLITQEEHHRVMNIPHFYAPKDKLFPDDSFNETDVSASIVKLKENSAELRDLNLNNIRDIPFPQFNDLCSSLRGNTHLESLSLSATGITDKFLRILTEALKENDSLVRLELSSNYLSGSAMVELLGAIGGSVREVRMTNQRPLNLGSKAENELLALVMKNDNLKVLSVDFSFPNVRFAVQKKLQENSFNARRRR